MGGELDAIPLDGLLLRMKGFSEEAQGRWVEGFGRGPVPCGPVAGEGWGSAAEPRVCCEPWVH